jgi:hypothetical protein
MYTNIDTKACILQLTSYLTNTSALAQFPHLLPTALIKALHIVMKNSRMKFGNFPALQHKGIAARLTRINSFKNPQTHPEHLFANGVREWREGLT